MERRRELSPGERSEHKTTKARMSPRKPRHVWKAVKLISLGWDEPEGRPVKLAQLYFSASPAGKKS